MDTQDVLQWSRCDRVTAVFALVPIGRGGMGKALWVTNDTKYKRIAT